MNTNSGWTRFWNEGTWWKAFLLIAVYWGVYQLISLGVTTVAGDSIDMSDPLASPMSVIVGEALPILLSGLLLLFFARSVGWLGDIFGRQRPRGAAWMWIAVILVIIPVVMRLVATNWSVWSIAQVAAILLLGLCVGFTEELATRGIVVTMLRRGGSSERIVFVLSALIFGLLHVGNLVSGQAVDTVALTVVYTIGFGAMMYLSLRVTGSIVWPILLHAVTDPTTILASGGIDAHSAALGSASSLVVFAGFFNVAYLLFAFLAIFLIKGRMTPRQPVDA